MAGPQATSSESQQNELLPIVNDESGNLLCSSTNVSDKPVEVALTATVWR